MTVSAGEFTELSRLCTRAHRRFSRLQRRRVDAPPGPRKDRLGRLALRAWSSYQEQRAEMHEFRAEEEYYD